MIILHMLRGHFIKSWEKNVLLCFKRQDIPKYLEVSSNVPTLKHKVEQQLLTRKQHISAASGHEQTDFRHFQH